MRTQLHGNWRRYWSQFRNDCASNLIWIKVKYEMSLLHIFYFAFIILDKMQNYYKANEAPQYS